MEHYITFLANTGTFIVSIVSLLTLFEMRTQRKSQIRPSIIFESSNYSINDDLFYENIDYKTTPPSSKEFSFRITNISACSARNISISYKFNFNVFKTVISCASIKVSQINKNVLRIMSDLGQEEIEADLPAYNELKYLESDYHGVEVLFPRSYKVLLMLYNFKSKSIENNKMFPDVILNLKYEDIFGHRYTNRYRIVTNFASITIDGKSVYTINFTRNSVFWFESNKVREIKDI